MGQSALSPSDNIIRPASLTERLAAAVPVEAPAQPEATVSSMAERFAPEGQKGLNEGPGRPLLEPAVIQGLIPQAARAPSANRGLLVASILVSLVPTAIILALLWQGAIRLPGAERAIIADNDGQLAASQQASVVSVPLVETVQPKTDIALTAPGRIEAKAGEEVGFDIAVDSADALPARSVIAIRAMPDGATFSQGRPYGATEWSLRPDEIGDLRLHLPKAASVGADLRIELMAADGTILASATTRLDVAPDPRSALILRSEESGRIDDLMAHGQKMIDVGYLAGARAYFKRAAEAGSGEAALKLGATYDPTFIEKIGAQGIKADTKEARAWYERAKQLGVDGADEELAKLKDDWTESRGPVPRTEASSAPGELATAAVSGGTEASPAATGAVSVVPVASAPDGALPTGKEEWVALSGYANVRAAPSSTAETLRVAQKGTKLRVTARKGSWVQVTDPATAETGWVYSRFVETAQTPAR
jgi:TPR repeat protein